MLFAPAWRLDGAAAGRVWCAGVGRTHRRKPEDPDPDQRALTPRCAPLDAMALAGRESSCTPTAVRSESETPDAMRDGRGRYRASAGLDADTAVDDVRCSASYTDGMQVRSCPQQLEPSLRRMQMCLIAPRLR